MTEERARILIVSVRRSSKQSKKTDMELLDDCQMGALSGAISAFLIGYLSIDLVMQYPMIGSILLLCLFNAFAMMVNRAGQCIGTKKILFQKGRLNLD